MKKTLANIALAGTIASLGACTSMTSQRDTEFNADMASQYSNSQAYDLGTNSVVLDRADNVSYKNGSPVNVNPNSFVGKKAIIHYDENNDFGVTVQVEDVSLDETYRISCSLDENEGVVNYWKCNEYIEKPNQGGSDGSSGGSSGGGSGGGGSGGGGSGGGGTGGGAWNNYFQMPTYAVKEFKVTLHPLKG